MAKKVEETKKCKHCQSDIPAKAKVCPNCRKKQGMSLWLKIVIGIVVIGILGAAFGGGSNDDSNKENVLDNNADTSTIEWKQVTADDLRSDLDTNAAAAKAKWNNQYVEITGLMNVVDSDLKYIAIYSINNQWDMKGIQCYLKDQKQKDKVLTFATKQQITVRGKIKDVGEVLGYSMDVIEFVD